jgi:hypothetical protein
LIINKSLAASSWYHFHLLIEDAWSSEHKIIFMTKQENGPACLDTSERINYLAPAGN